MSVLNSRRRIAAAAATVISLLGFTMSTATAGTSASPSHDSPASIVGNTRPNAMPTIQGAEEARGLKDRPHAGAATAAINPNELSFGGGTNGIGVMSGAKTRVYLVFYGNQWGAKSTDANGNLKFSGDPYGAASAAQQMFKGIGTNGETWSADLTQWCDGPGVSTGAYSCPANLPAGQYVPYQSGGVLAGTWYDNAAPEPSKPDGHQLGVEAVNAAAHFGNTTAASNRNAYYVVMSPHGTDPDNYQDPIYGYCAWHNWNGATGLTGGPVPSPYGNIAFSNQPYNMDFLYNGQSECGIGFVNGASGTLDGYTMTLGHEWHEMISDVDPASGWSNPGTNGGVYQNENSDECAWIPAGQTGGAANISFGSFGSFTEQASWSNDTNSCAISHPIVNHGTGGSNAITNGGFENSGLSGWVTSGITSVTTSGPNSGSHAAVVGSTSPSNTSSIAQTFTAKSGDTTLSFYYNVTCADTVAYDWATATLKDNTTGTTSTILPDTCLSSSGWVKASTTITAGHGYTLTLINHDDNYPGDPTFTKFDDVATS